ncbi:GPR26 protein, partial [Chloroceryle aenea]|nr:GPR26 protein [Chloroceryle aenea]
MDLAGVLLALLLVLVLVISLLSNLLVLLCFVYSTEIRKQVAGVFLVNLSFCNLLLTVLNMPFTLLGILRNQQPLGGCVCKAVGFLETFLTSNTMLSMAALSIDKWIAVVFPLSYTSKMRYKDAVILMGYSWLHSLTFPLVSLFYSWVDYSSVYASCTLHLKEETERRRFTVFTIVFHSTSFMLSLVILCFTYLKVLKVARFHCKRIDIITMQTLVLLVDIHPRKRTEGSSRLKKASDLTSSNSDVLGVNVMLRCFHLSLMFNRLIELLPFVTINYYWGIISKCLTYSKAASDPFVYSLLRQQYKKVLINIVNRILKRDLYPSSGYNSSLDTENDYCLHRTN